MAEKTAKVGKTSNALTRRLASLARVVSERKVGFELISGGPPSTDCSNIQVPADPLPNVNNRVEDLLVKKHQTVHESAHVKFTDRAAWLAMIGRAKALPPDQGRLLRDLSNIVEDAAVELAVANDRPGTASLIQWGNDKAVGVRPTPEQRLTAEGKIAALVEAVAQKAINGKLNGPVPEDITAEYAECLPIIDKGRYSRTTSDRMAAADRLFTVFRRLVDEGAPAPSQSTTTDHDENTGSNHPEESNPQAEFQPPDPDEEKSSGDGKSDEDQEKASSEQESSSEKGEGEKSNPATEGESSGDDTDSGEDREQSEDEAPEPGSDGQGDEDAGDEDAGEAGADEDPQDGKDTDTGGASECPGEKAEDPDGTPAKPGGSESPGDNGDDDSGTEPGGNAEEDAEDADAAGKSRISLDFDTLLDEAATEMAEIEHEEKGEVPQYQIKPVPRDKGPLNGKSEVYKQLAASVAPTVRRLTEVFDQYFPKRNSRMTASTRGRINPAKLWHDADPNYRNMFERRERPKKLDLFVAELVDCSGSMQGPNFHCARDGAIILHETLERQRVPHIIVGHTYAYYGAVMLYPFFTPSQPDVGLGLGTSRLERMDGNCDGGAVRDMTKLLVGQPQRHKVLFVLNDGRPAESESEFAPLIDTKVAIQEAQRAGITVIGISIGKDHGHMKQLYDNRVCVEDPSTLPARMAELLARLCVRWAQ